MRTHPVAPLLALALSAVGCGSTHVPPSATATTETPTSRTEVTDDELVRLRAAMPRLRAGMSHAEVLAAIDVSLDGLGQIGTGPTHEATTVYVLGHASQLNLTWDATDPEHLVLVRAELIEPAPPTP